MATSRSEPGIYWQSLGGNNDRTIGGNCHRYDLVTREGGRREARSLVVDYGVRFAEGSPDYDSFMPDPAPLFVPGRGAPDALLFTHGHQDHIGALPHLLHMGYRLPPLYATPFTAELIKLELAAGRIGAGNRPDLRVVRPGETVRFGKAAVDFIPVDHLPDAVALRIRTPEATVFHTGDFKFDPSLPLGRRADLGQWAQLGKDGIDAVFADSTAVAKDGPVAGEAEIQASIARILAAREGRQVVAPILASQMDRLVSAARAARAQGRVPVVGGASLVNHVRALRAAGHDLDAAAGGIATGSTAVFTYKQAARQGIRRDQMLILTTGPFAQPNSGLERAARGAHDFIALDPDTTVLFLQGPIPPVELEVGRMIKAMEARGAEVITPQRAVEMGFGPTHRSGHAGRQELLSAMSLLRPRVWVPIHGNVEQIEAHARLAGEAGIPCARLPENGHVLRVAEGAVREVGKEDLAQIGIRGQPVYRYDREHFAYDRLAADGRLMAAEIDASSRPPAAPESLRMAALLIRSFTWGR